MYVDVFYVTVLSRAVSMIFCFYMIVMIFKPHYFDCKMVSKLPF